MDRHCRVRIRLLCHASYPECRLELSVESPPPIKLSIHSFESNSPTAPPPKFENLNAVVEWCSKFENWNLGFPVFVPLPTWKGLVNLVLVSPPKAEFGEPDKEWWVLFHGFNKRGLMPRSCNSTRSSSLKWWRLLSFLRKSNSEGKD